MVNNSNGFCICYSGTQTWCNQWKEFAIVAHDVESAIEGIEKWHTYGAPNRDTLKVNATTRKKLERIFEEGHLEMCYNSWTKESNEKNFETVRTTNCGAWTILITHAKAPTLEEHLAVVQAEREAEKQERIRKSHEARHKKEAEWSEIKRGWYQVYFEGIKCITTYANFTYKDWSGICLADSKLDAATKALDQVDTDLAANGLQKAFVLDAMSADVEFLGMRVEHGYSLDAWEKFSKTEDYKQSLNH